MELDSLLQDLKGLIEIPSVTKSGPACDRALAYMLELGTRYGFETKNLDGVCGYIDYGTGDEIFAILCHLDVVPPGEGWTKEPFALTVEGGNAYGRGTLDDKGPAVIALHAMKAAKEAGVVPPYRVRLILGTDEESGDWTGIERYKQTEKLPLYAVTPDGDYPVIHSEKGIVNYEISCASGADFTLQGGSASNMVPATCRYVRGEKSICAAGKAAHGSTPWEGENAITACLAQIDEDYPLINFYKAYMDETGEKLGIAQEDESGALTINAGVMEINETGGKLVLNIRYPKGLAEDVIFDTLCQKAEGLQVERQGINEPLWIDPADEFVQFLLDIYEQEVGERPEPLAIGGGTYARAFPKAASFGVCFPDTPQIMHQADEFIRLADIEKNLAIYTALIKALK